MSSRFVEFTGRYGYPAFVDAGLVIAVSQRGNEVGATYAEILTAHGMLVEVRETPAEVVAKLQSEPQSLATELLREERESEAVQLLEEWDGWWRQHSSFHPEGVIYKKTRALLAKLKGGEL